MIHEINNWWARLCWIKNFCFAKDNVKTDKISHRLERIFSTIKEYYPKHSKSSESSAKRKKKNQPNQKIDKGPDTSLVKIYRWQISIWKDASCHMPWGMQITAMRYHYTPVIMAKILNSDNTKHWWGCGTIGMLTHC